MFAARPRSESSQDRNSSSLDAASSGVRAHRLSATAARRATARRPTWRRRCDPSRPTRSPRRAAARGSRRAPPRVRAACAPTGVQSVARKIVVDRVGHPGTRVDRGQQLDATRPQVRPPRRAHAGRCPRRPRRRCRARPPGSRSTISSCGARNCDTRTTFGVARSWSAVVVHDRHGRHGARRAHDVTLESLAARALERRRDDPVDPPGPLLALVDATKAGQAPAFADRQPTTGPASRCTAKVPRPPRSTRGTADGAGPDGS